MSCGIYGILHRFELFCTIKNISKCISAPKSKRTVVRMKIQSDADLTDQAVSDGEGRGRKREIERVFVYEQLCLSAVCVINYQDPEKSS